MALHCFQGYVNIQMLLKNKQGWCISIEDNLCVDQPMLVLKVIECLVFCI